MSLSESAAVAAANPDECSGQNLIPVTVVWPRFYIKANNGLAGSGLGGIAALCMQ